MIDKLLRQSQAKELNGAVVAEATILTVNQILSSLSQSDRERLTELSQSGSISEIAKFLNAHHIDPDVLYRNSVNSAVDNFASDLGQELNSLADTF